MAENILETIAAKRRIYIEEKKKQVPLKNLISQAEALLQKEAAGEVSAKPSFYDSLAGDKLSFICEVKKASPSKGLIAPDFPYLTIAREYESAGAAAISVLTEPEYFLGRDEYLKEIAFKASTLLYNKIGYIILDTEGVIDYISLKINGDSTNIAIKDNELVVRGKFEVTE